MKVQSFKLEELEQYAEDILSYGLMEVEDQVKIAQCINGSLKNVEQLKQACRTKENRYNKFALTNLFMLYFRVTYLRVAVSEIFLFELIQLD